VADRLKVLTRRIAELEALLRKDSRHVVEEAAVIGWAGQAAAEVQVRVFGL
jgi:hypothetical protein